MANLENMINMLKNVLHKKGDIDGIYRIKSKEGYLKNEMRLLDGTGDIDGNPSLAMAGRIGRNWMSMAKLGGAVISSLSDTATFASEFAFQGQGAFRSLLRGLGHFVKGRGNDETQRFLSCCGVFFDSMSGAIATRFSGNDVPGKMSAMMNLFFRMNLLSWWTDSWKKAACLMMAHDLAQIRGRKAQMPFIF